MEIRTEIEPHIEVHKFQTGAVVGATALALVLQASLPVRFHWAAWIELPLLITLYFGLSRRNPSSGLLLGMVIGILQDRDRKSTRLNSSHLVISYAVFCLKKKKKPPQVCLCFIQSIPQQLQLLF